MLFTEKTVEVFRGFSALTAKLWRCSYQSSDPTVLPGNPSFQLVMRMRDFCQSAVILQWADHANAHLGWGC